MSLIVNQSTVLWWLERERESDRGYESNNQMFGYF